MTRRKPSRCRSDPVLMPSARCARRFNQPMLSCSESVTSWTSCQSLRRLLPSLGRGSRTTLQITALRPFEELQERNNAILRDILDEASKPAAAPELKKVGDYYASCMAETAIDAKGKAPLTPDLLRVAAIKDKAEIPAVVGHMHTVGMSGFFGFGAAPTSRRDAVCVFGQGGLGLPDRDYYLKTM